MSVRDSEAFAHSAAMHSLVSRFTDRVPTGTKKLMWRTGRQKVFPLGGPGISWASQENESPGK
eukprot:1157936-Pelagomonas_calceolata.AAC.10